MRTSVLSRPVFSISAAASLLAGCGGPSQTQGTMPSAHSVLPAFSYKVIHRFAVGGRARSARPVAGMIVVNGTLYGTTGGKVHGQAECGTVFSMSTSGATKTLYKFHGPDGCSPFAPLLDVNGTLYGTTTVGGASGNGVVFSLTASGVENVLCSFKGGSDGAQPWAGLIDDNGTLYGTTTQGGGSSHCSSNFTHGCGTVYSITTSGGEKVLHSFSGPDGTSPATDLTDVNGTLYGTAFSGGGHGAGTVFSITTSGSEKTLYSFAGGTDGRWPFSALVNVNGRLYGTTENGGSSGKGNVYSITTNGSEKNVYSFTGGSDGDTPVRDLLDLDATIYGTTAYGGGTACNVNGSSGCGVVFTVTTGGSENVLYRFQGGSDGETPNGDLVDVNGTLYGTTIFGGGKGCFGVGCGTAYALSP